MDTLIQRADPHLATVRTMKVVAESKGDPVWNELECARHNLMLAFKASSSARAKEWWKQLKTVRLSILPGTLDATQDRALDRAIDCMLTLIEAKDGWRP